MIIHEKQKKAKASCNSCDGKGYEYIIVTSKGVKYIYCSSCGGTGDAVRINVRNN